MQQSFAAIVLMLASGVSAGAGAGIDHNSEVYRWKDGSGVVHYSDTPPSNGKFTRVRLASSLTTTVDDRALRSVGAGKAASADRVMDKSTVAGVDSASDIAGAGAGAVDSEPAEPAEAPGQEASAFVRRSCAEAREQLQYVERRATEKPADDPRRAGSRELEHAYQSRLTAHNNYQSARDAQLLRVGRFCAE